LVGATTWPHVLFVYDRAWSLASTAAPCSERNIAGNGGD
jgi:hypothetical protein